MRVKILGSSSSGNCYLLQSKTQTLIIECGVDIKQILKNLNFDIGNVIGCLVSHEHKDHSKYIWEIMRKGIDVFASQGTFESLGIEKFMSHRINYLISETVQKIGDFVVIPFRTKHDATEPLGLYIYHSEMGSMLFATDTYYIDFTFKDVDHIFIECNYAKDILQGRELPLNLKRRIIKSHFELGNVRKYLGGLDISKTKEIVLLHLSDGNSDSGRFKVEIEGLTGKPVYIADKGLELELE